MTLVSKSIPALVNGVSQQAPAVRLDSQVEAAENVYMTLVDGVQRRPPTKHLAKIAPFSTDLQSAYTHAVRRDATESYQVVIAGADLKVYDLLTGTEQTVTFPTGKGYLAGNSAETRFRAVTVGDFTFLVNRGIKPQMRLSTTPSRSPEALLFVRAGSYAQKMSVTLDGPGGALVYTITLPQVPSTGGDANKYAIFTDYIAQSFANFMTTGTPSPGHAAGTPTGSATAQGYTVEVSGSLVRVSRADNQEFTFTSSDGEGENHLRAIKGSIQRLSELPRKGWPGFVIKVTGDTEADGNPYWAQFTVEGSSTGFWKEVAAPGTPSGFDRASMPHVLVSQGSGQFIFRQGDWEDREAGDTKTNPSPSFIGKQIEDVFLVRGRLGFLTGQNVVLSRAAGKQFNYWREKSSRVLDTDPIDIAVTHTSVAQLYHAVPQNDDLILFSEYTQFRLSAAGETLSPNTVEVRPLSSYESSPECRPISTGNMIFFATARKGFAGILEYSFQRESRVAVAQGNTDQVPRFISGTAVKISASSTESLLLVRSSGEENALYVYNWYVSGNDKPQSAWSRWTFSPGSKVLSMDVFGSTVSLVILRADGLFLETINLVRQVSEPTSHYVVHLDRRLGPDQVSFKYRPAQGLTEITLPYEHDQATQGRIGLVPVTADPSQGFPDATYGTMASASVLIMPGDYTGANLKFFIGVEYFSWQELSEQFAQDNTSGSKRPVLEGRTQLKRMRVLHRDTPGMLAGVTPLRVPSELSADGPLTFNPDPAVDADRNNDDRPDDWTDDIIRFDIGEADAKAYAALKKFDQEREGDPNVQIEYLDPTPPLPPTTLPNVYATDPNVMLEVSKVSGALQYTARGLRTKAITTTTYLTSQGQATSVTTTESASWGDVTGSKQMAIGGGIIVIAGPLPLVGTTPIGGGKWAYIADWNVVFCDADGNRYNSASFLVDGTAPYSGGLTYVTPTVPGFVLLQRTSTGEIADVKAVTVVTPPPEEREYGGDGGGTYTYQPPPIVTFSVPPPGPQVAAFKAFYGRDPQTTTTSTPGVPISTPVVTTTYAIDDEAEALFALVLSDTWYVTKRFLATEWTNLGTGPEGPWRATFTPTGTWTEGGGMIIRDSAVPFSASQSFVGGTLNSAYVAINADPTEKIVAQASTVLLPVPATTPANTPTASVSDDSWQYTVQSYTGPMRVKITGVVLDGTFEAQLASSADITYWDDAQVRDILAPGIVSWSATFPGVKAIRIVHKASGNVVGTFSLGSGLVRSYVIPDAADRLVKRALDDRCFLYDQAVAIIAAVIKRDEATATRWVNGLLKAQDPVTGNFPFSVNRLSALAPDPYFRGGASWWCVEALAFFAKVYDTHPLVAPHPVTGASFVRDAVYRAADHLIANYLVTTAGHPQKDLFRGGKGRYASDYSSFDGGYLIPWISLEHNVDAYFALRSVHLMWGRTDYLATATSLGDAIVSKMWITEDGRLAQGIAPTELPPGHPAYIGTGLNVAGTQTIAYAQDWGGALDLNSWGVLFLAAYGRTDLANLAIRWVDRFRFRDGARAGYTPYVSDLSGDGSYAGVTPGVWAEGTFGVILARRTLGQERAALRDYAELYPALTPRGYPYTTVPDTFYELQDWESVAGTAWAVLAANPRGFWESAAPYIGGIGLAQLEGVTPPIQEGSQIDFTKDPNNPDSLIVTIDTLQTNVYRHSNKGEDFGSRARSSMFRLPIHMKSNRTRIRLSSQDHYPMTLTTLEWEGFRTGKTRRVP